MISKKQVILLSGSVLLLGALVVLPIGVVKKENKPAIDKPTSKPETTEESSQDLHAVELPIELKKEVVKLEKEFAVSKSPAVAEKIGDLFSDATAFDSAVYYYEKAAKLKDNLALKIKLSEAYYSWFGVTEGKNDKVATSCKETLKEIVTISPSNLEAKSKLGYLMTLTSQAPMEGVAILKEVLAVDPQYRTALFNLGLLDIRSGQIDKAIPRFEKILTLDASDQISRFYLAICFKEKKELTKVRDLVNIIAKSNADPVLIGEAQKLLVD